MNKINYKKRKRLAFILFTFIFVATILVAKISYIKLVKSKEYEMYARDQQFRRVNQTLSAERGHIKDRNENDLVLNEITYDVIIDPTNIRNSDYTKEIKMKLEKIFQIIEVESDKVDEYVKLDTKYKVVKKGISEKIMKEIKEDKPPQLTFEEKSERVYIYDDFASHLLGFGGWGIEGKYNEELSGLNGRRVAVFDDNNYILHKEIPAYDGKDVILTIDKNIQHFVETAILKAYEKHEPKKISAIAMKPDTGEILAMANYPNFNLNNPTRIYKNEENKDEENKNEKKDEERQLLNANELNRLWRNPIISDTYEPGSTFKTILVAAALEENVVKPEDTFYCSGSKEMIDGTIIHCHKREGHGKQDLEEALMNSCNVAMMEIAEKMGRDEFYKYQKAFGFGYKTRIDLPGEEVGILYDKDELNPVELATTSFGQGFNVTMIQMVNSVNAIINGGELLKPFVVKRIEDKNGNIVEKNQKTVVRKIISEDSSNILLDHMESVVSEGTGKRAYIDGYKVGGKTATAQKGVRSDEKYTLSFIGFAPVENPEIIVLVMLDETENKDLGGGSAAGPVVKEIIGKSLEYFGIPKVEMEEINLVEKKIEIGNYLNREIDDVKEELKTKELNFKVIGHTDKITSQMPEAGTKVPVGTTIYLYAEKIEKTE